MPIRFLNSQNSADVLFGKKKSKKENKDGSKAKLKTQQEPQAAAITTPKKFAIDFAPDSKGDGTGERTLVQIRGDEVQFSSPLKPTYILWQPPPDFALKPAPGVWTKRYIGTDQDFYGQGYRWGVSLGNSYEAFQKSALFKAGGGINLPDGKYMIVFRGDKNGLKEIVIGKEDRGIDQRVLKAMKSGEAPKTGPDKQILGVANHSMLGSRGQAFDPAHAEDFSAIFAGEITVEDHQINTLNDQSGQFFGPNGITKPLSPETEPTDAEKIMKQPDYEAVKTNALVTAKTMLETVTATQNIHMIKVAFVRDAAPVEELKQPHSVSVKTATVDKLKGWLKEPEVQALFDQLDAVPELQDRLVKALAKNGSSRRPILKLIQDLVGRETMKPLQGSKLAVELFTEPNGIGLFVPGNPYYIKDLSDNTKRKLLSAYNSSDIKDDMTLEDLVASLRNKHPVVVKFMVGRRIAGGFIKKLLTDLKDATQAIQATIGLFSADEACPTAKEATATLGNDPVYLHRLDRGKRGLKDIEKLHRKKPNKPIDVVLVTNPFDLPDYDSGHSLPNAIKTLRKLQENGVYAYRLVNVSDEHPMEYLNNLFAHVHPAQTPEQVTQKNQIRALLRQYDVKVEALRDFARTKFTDRWANDLIVASYAQEDKGFRTLIEDLVWYRSLAKVDPFTPPQ